MSTDRLDERREAVRKWKARTAEAQQRCEVLAKRASEAEDKLRLLKREVATARREAPSIAVLRQTFAHRLRTLRARTSHAPDPAGEARLLEASPAYRDAVEQRVDPRAGGAARGSLDDMLWWNPGRSKETRFPYRGILQTREAASGGVMLDLGANVGRMAIPRVVLGDVTLAYCAEPDPLTFACLARNVIDNGLRGLVLPDQIAISDREGTARLLRSGHSGNFRLVSDNVTTNIVEVPCCTLDAWVGRLGIDLDAVTFVKVDVEGAERRVLAGGGRVLACRHIAWQMEIKPSGLTAAGDAPATLYADLQRWFTHFIDLNRAAAGRRVREVAELAEALAYIEPDAKTDVLLFSADGPLD